MVLKLKKKIEKVFDRKRIPFAVRAGLFILLLAFVLGIVNFSLSKYETDVTVNVAPKIAFFIANAGTYENRIELTKILPSTSPYLYSFTVSNFKDDRRINVDLEYTIEFVTTTNLPLNFKVFRNTAQTTGSGIISSDTIVADDDGMYLRKMTNDQVYQMGYTTNITDTYVLLVEFPDNYKYNSDAYEGVLDLIEVKVVAKQVIGD